MKAIATLLIFTALAVAGCGFDMIASHQDGASSSPSSETLQALATEPKKTVSEPTDKNSTQKENKMELQTATFGAGCFWCVEASFQLLDGVESVVPGYMGGQTENPTYKQVCSGATGHAEVIQIKYNPAKVSYETLLAVFFQQHDSTQLNRQGNDVGTQYRSAIFFHSDEQQQIANRVKTALVEQKVPVVTEITAASTMYVAEKDHHNYFNENPDNRYCRMVIPPKLDKLKKVFGDKLKTATKK